MWMNKSLKLLIVFISLALAIGLTYIVLNAQPPQPEMPGMPGPPMPPMMGPMMGPAAITAAGDYVYVVRGPTLYQVRQKDLKLMKQTNLPEPRMPMGPGMPPKAGEELPLPPLE